jgi:ribosomal protein S18 acetylase RimI-like enzyme
MVPGTSVPATLRPLAASDSSAARALAVTVFGDAPYAEPLLAALETALARATDEHQAVVACDANALVGLVVFGEIAGARGAGRIHVVAVDANARRRGIAIDLIDAACTRLGEQGGRFVMIELPGDARLTGARRMAQRAGFHEEGRMDDYVRDGVALVLLRRDLRHEVRQGPAGL